MATPKRLGARWFVLPESDDERLFLGAAAPKGHLVLDGAVYATGDDRLALPSHFNEGDAWAMCRIFEAAARRHQEAIDRRSRFSALKSLRED